MINNKSNFKKLPKNIKFATINSYDDEDIIIELLIANLIYNGYSFNEILKSTYDTENEKDRDYMKHIITTIISDFIKLNPEFALILERNNKAQEFLNSIGLDS